MTPVALCFLQERKHRTGARKQLPGVIPGSYFLLVCKLWFPAVGERRMLMPAPLIEPAAREREGRQSGRRGNAIVSRIWQTA